MGTADFYDWHEQQQAARLKDKSTIAGGFTKTNLEEDIAGLYHEKVKLVSDLEDIRKAKENLLVEDLRKTSDLESNLEDKTAVREQTEQKYNQSTDMMNEKEQPEPVDSDRKTIQ